MATDQPTVDRGNAAFWNELCGTWLAKQLGISEPTPENLKRFDDAYLDIYPYLDDHLPGPESKGQRLLEIGLGFGSVCQMLAARGLDYHGLDVAEGPVEMARYRLAELDFADPDERVQVGSALELPHDSESFDHVVTIGCLHHTGDLPRAVAEVERVLRPGGRALVMLYNRHSFRRFTMSVGGAVRRLRGDRMDEEEIRGRYDRNVEGEAAPTTDFTSVRQAKHLFRHFSQVRIVRENFDDFIVGRLVVPRPKLLGWPARLAGLDLYISAVK